MSVCAATGVGACDSGDEGGTESTDPAIVITAPEQRRIVSEPELGISFTVRNFTMKAPGDCAGAANCGHVHLLIDDDACNAPGMPYNNADFRSPIDAKLELCGDESGPRVIKLELHDDDHAAIMIDGVTVQSNLTIMYVPGAEGG